jgi:hypothetical protein
MDASEPFHAELVGGIFNILSPVSSAFFCSYQRSLQTFRYEISKWLDLTSQLLMTAQEGIVLNINFREYKVVRILSFTYRVVNGIAIDSTSKLFFPVKLKDGMYDLAAGCDFSESVDKKNYQEVGSYNKEIIYLIKLRCDRIYPDSAQQISSVQIKSIRYDTLLRKLLVANVSSEIQNPQLYFRDSICKGKGQDVKGFLFDHFDNDWKSDILHRAMGDKSILNFPFANSIEERVYFYNVYNYLLVSDFIVKKKRRKEYTSRGDVFTLFREATLRTMVPMNDGYIRYGSFQLNSFNNFVLRHSWYIRDNLAHDLRLYKRLPHEGTWLYRGVGKLHISKKRPKEISYRYRGFFVWFTCPRGDRLPVSYSKDREKKNYYSREDKHSLLPLKGDKDIV